MEGVLKTTLWSYHLLPLLVSLGPPELWREATKKPRYSTHGPEWLRPHHTHSFRRLTQHLVIKNCFHKSKLQLAQKKIFRGPQTSSYRLFI